MKIGILGYGKEGKSAEQYFRKHNAEVQIFDQFTPADLIQQDFSKFDLIMRSPSVPPFSALLASSEHANTNTTSNPPQHASTQNSSVNNWSSGTRYFFDHCPCPIIGVTGTKGKGTTCSIITALLKNLGKNVFLVGNIGSPALDVLDQLQPTDVVVYEMSSFQLWDLEKSPHIAVVLGIEPDHLNVHRDFQDYVAAKANIARHQTANDICIYYAPNPDSSKIAHQSQGQHIPYPLQGAASRQVLNDILPHLAIPGRHNQDNAEAALLAVANLLNLSLTDFVRQHHQTILQTFTNFQGLPHRLQYLRTLNNVRYFDDNFSTTPTSLKVALEAFPDSKVVLILGGRDKTDNQDFSEILSLISRPNVARIVFIGESGHALSKIIHSNTNANTSPLATRTATAETLTEAIQLAATAAEGLTLAPDDNTAFLPSQPILASNQPKPDVVVLMSPAAASFDMFENVYARGAEFQKLIQELA